MKINYILICDFIHMKFPKARKQVIYNHAQICSPTLLVLLYEGKKMKLDKITQGEHFPFDTFVFGRVFAQYHPTPGLLCKTPGFLVTQVLAVAYFILALTVMLIPVAQRVSAVAARSAFEDETGYAFIVIGNFIFALPSGHTALRTKSADRLTFGIDDSLYKYCRFHGGGVFVDGLNDDLLNCVGFLCPFIAIRFHFDQIHR